MSSFPSTSSTSLQLRPEHYDVAQLTRAVQGLKPSLISRIFQGKEQREETGTGDDDLPDLFHAHTLSIECSLTPRPEHLMYYGRDPQPNPDYKSYQTLCNAVQTAGSPVEPILLTRPTFRLLKRSNNVPKYRQAQSLSVLLPTSHPKRPVAELMVLLPNGGKEWSPSSMAWDTLNWVHATSALDPTEPTTRKGAYRDEKERVKMKAGIAICWIPTEVEAYLDMSIICDPLPPVGHTLLALILHSILPSTTATRPNSDSEARAAALLNFHRCLRPAEDLPIDIHVDQLQPKEMVSRLLPFQRRTTALLMQREGSSIVGRRQKQALDPTGFWEALDMGLHGRWAYRRLTGELISLVTAEAVNVDRKGKGRARDADEDERKDRLSREDRARLPVRLDLSEVRGTMLCEEMGLGKTVEAIALTLLHPHPLSAPRHFEKDKSTTGRSGKPSAVPVIDLTKPIDDDDDESLKRWVDQQTAKFESRTTYDKEAELHVAEVAATLIVTPPTLLKQWVSEISKHAPSVRVCVYEGWRSLRRGVEKQRAVQERVREKNETAKRKRTNTLQREEVVRKYTRVAQGAKVKVEHEFDGEIDELAEDLKISIEDGEEEETLSELTQREFVKYVRAHDIVITTYQDLGQDLEVARAPPKRSRRANASYAFGSRPRSPLVMVEWWRVIMDEVQLQGDSTKAADMVSLLPRNLSLAVSGTPARADIKDLMGSLKFLRVPVLPYDGLLWYRLQQPSMRPAFEGLFRSLAVRTTKAEVAGEFHLPSQSRYIVPIDLSDIETHYYSDTLERQRVLLGLGDGIGRPNDWTLNRGLFRNCLIQLRQICTHIQVGQMQQPVRGEQRLYLGRALMTMSEALAKIREDHSQEYILESRLQLRAILRKAQLVMLDEKDTTRRLKALTLYEKVRARTNALLGPVRDELARLSGEREGTISDDGTPERMLTQHEREKHAVYKETRSNSRELLLLLHQAWFYEGDIRHQLKEEEAEVNCYAQAELVRKEILARPLQIANKSCGELGGALQKALPIESVDELQTKQALLRGGIMSYDIAQRTNELFKILNENALLIFNWRETIVKLLAEPVDPDIAEVRAVGEGQDVEDPEKEYYAQALNAQGDVEAHLIAYAAVLADRREFIFEERSLLAAHDARLMQKRTTYRSARAMEDTEIPPEVIGEVAEQATELMHERQLLRDARVEQGCEKPLKAMLMELNQVVHGGHRAEEMEVAKGMVIVVKEYIEKQRVLLEKLNKELEILRKTFNKRVGYFAALQAVSDSVAEPEFLDLKKEIKDASEEIDSMEVKLARMVVKGRYLQYLGSKDQDAEELREDCIICMGSSDDSSAVLLECGHFFCESCFKEYRRSPQSRRCPSCRVQIDERSITKIKLKQNQEPTTEKPEELLNAEAAVAESAAIAAEAQTVIDHAAIERQRRLEDLERIRMMDKERQREIALMDIMGEYGSKINFLIKHLLYYQFKEPDARHVVFSNWSDSLTIVIRALISNNITFASLEQGKKGKDVVDRFQKDASITVFLLHAERESSGLTLTSCRVVHLLEPVLKHGFELQAIGRVDRLGQEKETTVYCYATMETVEARILSQGVRNGTSIYLKDKSGDQVVANMPNVASAAHKGGDVGNDGSEEDLIGLIL